MFRRILLSIVISMLALLYVTNASAEVMLEDLDGTAVPLSSLKGKWVFINFWASWCSPCLAEISELNRFYEQNKSHHVAVFAVNYDALPLYKQQRLIRKFGIHYPSLKHNSVHALHLGNISVVPVTFVYNPQGKFSTVLYGGQTLESLNEVITTS